VAIWGNHSTTQYPDINHALVGSEKASDLVDETWVREDFIPRVQKRGAEIIQARGLSSAASAASAAIDHMRDWELGSPENDWVSMAIPSDGSYGISEGIIFSYPIVCQNGDFSIIQDLDLDNFSLDLIKHSEKELLEEREAIKHLL
jgi:malate dehydrogenase